MKTLTVELSEDIYDQAERRAAAHGTTLGEQAKQLLREFAKGEGDAATTASGSDVAGLFATLDKARNATSVGSLRRDELYDRDDQQLSAARARMAELFRTVTGFRLGAKIPREELHERGSLR